MKIKLWWKKRSEYTQTLHVGCSKAEPKIFHPVADPFPGTQDGQNLISWRWSLPLPTNPVLWGSMHAILNYRGNRPTNTCRPPARCKLAHRQDWYQYTAPLSLACSVIIIVQHFIRHHNMSTCCVKCHHNMSTKTLQECWTTNSAGIELLIYNRIVLLNVVHLKKNKWMLSRFLKVDNGLSVRCKLLHKRVVQQKWESLDFMSP